jgi:hypothetical protein
MDRATAVGTPTVAEPRTVSLSPFSDTEYAWIVHGDDTIGLVVCCWGCWGCCDRGVADFRTDNIPVGIVEGGVLTEEEGEDKVEWGGGGIETTAVIATSVCDPKVCNVCDVVFVVGNQVSPQPGPV